MPSFITHGISAYLIGKMFLKEAKSLRFWFWSAICAILPDIDVIGFHFGIQYGDFWGHRGFTHSLTFALISAILICLIFYRDQKLFSRRWGIWVLFYFSIMASHGIFDALTDGGLGIALFSPFSNERFFFPYTPILVSPIGYHGIWSFRTIYLLLSETIYVTIPLLFALLIIIFYRKRRFQK